MSSAYKTLGVGHMDDTLTKERSQSQKMSVVACVMWALGAIFYCYEYYLRVAPSVMTSDLALAYNADAATLGNLAAFYYYAYTSMQIPVGVLMDRFGPRRILTIACFLCSAGSYLFCATDQFWVAAIGRFLVGFGSAFAYVGVLKLTTLWLPSNLFAMFSGLATTLGMVGAISGDLVMTELVRVMGWKDTVYYSAVAGLILTPVLWTFLREKNPSSELLELPHASTPSVETLPETDTVISGLLKVIRNPQMWINGFFGCASYMIITTFAELWGIPFLRDVRHLSPEAAAVANSAIFLGFAFGGPIMGLASDRMNLRRLPMILGAILASICIIIAMYVPYISAGWLNVLLFLAGFFSGAEVIVFAVGRDNNEPHLVGTAVAFTNMVVMLGGVIFQPITGVLLDLFADGSAINGIRVYSTHDYQWAMASLPAMLVLGSLVIMLFMKETHGVYTPKLKSEKR